MSPTRLTIGGSIIHKLIVKEKQYLRDLDTVETVENISYRTSIGSCLMFFNSSSSGHFVLPTRPSSGQAKSTSSLTRSLGTF